MAKRLTRFRHGGASAHVLDQRDGTGFLSNVYSQRRGQGEARALLNEVVTWAEHRGMVLYLEVEPYGAKGKTRLTEEQLVRFYGSLGFALAEDGTSPPMMVRQCAVPLTDSQWERLFPRVWAWARNHAVEPV